jgi:hypothetical protein
VCCPRQVSIPYSMVSMDSKRDQKRQSAKKHSEYTIYSKKAVRAKEALIEKKCAVPAKAPSTK